MRRGILFIGIVLLLVIGVAGLWQWSARDAAAVERLADMGLLLEDTGEGLRVLAVREQSPARRAGFAPGDLLLTFNDLPLADEAQLEQAFNAPQAGRRLTFCVRRDGETLWLTFSIRRKSP